MIRTLKEERRLLRERLGSITDEEERTKVIGWIGDTSRKIDELYNNHK